MDNIKAPKFDNAKEQLKALEKKVPNKVTLDKVDTKGTIIPWNSHNVTGDEVNRLILNIEKSLIKVNENITPLYKEFTKVYNTFNELDNEYIQGILGAVKSANIASKQAKDASDKALRALGKAENAQNDIKKTIEALQITVNALKKFKESTTNKLNSLNELALMMGTLEKEKDNLKSDFLKLNKDFDEFTKNIREASKQASSDIAALQEYKSKLEAYEHLRDVDVIWANVEQHKKILTEFHQQLNGIEKEINESTKLFSSDIAALQNYKSKLEAYEHLRDVDAIWANVEQHKKNLTEGHQQFEQFAREYHSDKKDIQSSIETIIEENAKSNNAINKKIKVAYIVAGFSVTIAIVQFVLNLLHII